MSGITQYTKTGPQSYVPVSGQTVKGGTLVEARTGGRIGTAAAGSLKVLGAALGDAQSPEGVVTAGVVGADGRPVLNTAQLPTTVAVAYAPAEVKLTFTAAATFGERLVATADGKVGPAGATPDARSIVGICTEPAGVGAANGVGLVRLV